MSSEKQSQSECIKEVVAGEHESGRTKKDEKGPGIEEANEEKECNGESKLESHKNAAASLGLHRVTEKMLDTIKASRDIERNQRNVISKLALNSNGEEEEEEEEDDDDDRDDDDESERKRNIEWKTSRHPSLKRKRIPPALDLSSCSSVSTTAPNSLHSAIHRRNQIHRGRIESAPPNVSRFPHPAFSGRPTFKPRVQYLGKMRPVPALPQPQGYKLKTPFIPRMPVQPWQQQYYPPPYPSAPGLAPAPMLHPCQRTDNYPIPPRSAVIAQMPYYREYHGYTPHTTTQRKKPAQPPVAPPQHVAATAMGDAEDLRNGELESTTSHEAHREGEYSQLTVDDDTTFSPASDEPLQGEIRIQRDIFSFEFVESSPAIDKKMFMSICDKVWDESKNLQEC